jgi:nicotinamidase-related amidase
MMRKTQTTNGRAQALLLLDFQHDFLSDQGRMPVARHQVAPVITAANAAIGRARQAGIEIIAIGNEFRSGDWFMNLLRKNAAIAGSPGAAWDARVDIKGAIYFPKTRGNAFSNPDLMAFLAEQHAREIVLAGLYASACVTATAKGALAQGLRVRVLPQAVADASDRAREAALARLSRLGVTVSAELVS